MKKETEKLKIPFRKIDIPKLLKTIERIKKAEIKEKEWLKKQETCH